MANPIIGCAVQLNDNITINPGESRDGVIIEIIQGRRHPNDDEHEFDEPIPVYFLVLTPTRSFEIWVCDNCKLTDQSMQYFASTKARF